MGALTDGFKIKVEVLAQDSTGPGLSGVTNNLQGVESALEKIKQSSKGAGEGAFTGIVAGAGQAESAAAGVISELDKVDAKSKAVGSGNGFKDLAADALKAQAATDKVHASINAGAGKSTQVLQDMGRIIMDMPYGLMGIGNNIQPLVESFGRAKESAGGVGGAIKDIIASMAGPAGLAMIGIPIVTSLAIAFSGPLMKALGGASDGVEDLQKKLDGIQQYKDFDLTIRIAGLDGIARLKAELDQLIQKKAYLQNSTRLEAAASAATPSTVSRIVGGALYGQYYSPGSEYYQSKSALQNFNVSTAQQIASGKLSLGAGEDVRFLTTYLKKSKEDALNILATNKVNLDIAVKGAEINKQAAKDSEKAARSGASGAKAAESAAAKAEAQQHKWGEAVAAADKALQDIGETVPTVAEAAERVAAARAEVEKLKAASGEGKYDVEALTKATKSLSEAQRDQKKAVNDWERALDRSNALLNKNTQSQLSLIDAKAAEATARQAVVNAQLSGDTEQLTTATEKYGDALQDTAEATDTAAEKAQKLQDVFQGIGKIAELFGVSGSGVSGLLSGISSLSPENIALQQEKNPNLTTEQIKAQGYANVADSIGKIIGGKTGSAISNTASGALTGFMVAGPIGAAIGGGISLLGSIFGGNSQEKAQRVADRQSVYDQMVNNAKSGGAYSASLLKAGGYTFAGVSTLANVDPTKTAAKQGQLLNDSRGAELTTLSSALAILDTAAKSIAGLMTSSLLSTIKDIQTSYEISVGTLSELADKSTLVTARTADVMAAMGVTGESLTSTILDAVNSSDAAGAGEAFAKKLNDSITAGIQQMEVGRFLSEAIMPMLEPSMTKLTELLVGGGSQGAIAGAVAEVNAKVAEVTPLINQFATTLQAVGADASAADSATAGAAAAATDLTGAMGNLATSLTSAVDAAYEGGGSAGEIFVTTFTDSVLSGLKNAVISNFQTNILTPLLAPAFSAISAGITTAGFDQESITAAVGQAKDALVGAQPLVDQLMNTLQAAGLLSTTVAKVSVVTERVSTVVDAQEDLAAQQSRQLLAAQKNADDLQAAAEKARAAMAADAAAREDAKKAAVGRSYDVLQKAVGAQKDAAQLAYTSASDVINQSLSVVGDNISKLTSLNSDLTATISNLADNRNLQSYKAAQQEIFAALMVARTTGNLPVDGQLKGALSTVGQGSEKYYSSKVDYQRDLYKTTNALTALSALAGYKLTDAEQQKSLLDGQLKVLTDGFEAEQSRLDALLGKAQEQVDAVNGNSVAVMTIAAAISGFNAVTRKTGKNKLAYADGGVFLAGENGPELVNVGSSNAFISNAQDTRQMLNFDALVAELRALRLEVASLKKEAEKRTGYAETTRDTLKKFDAIGMPKERTV